MRLREGLVLRNIADEWVVIPTGQNTQDFSSVIVLNETGCFIWKMLESDVSVKEIVTKLVAEYNVEYSDAVHDVDEYVKEMRDNKLLVDDDE